MTNLFKARLPIALGAVIALFWMAAIAYMVLANPDRISHLEIILTAVSLATGTAAMIDLWVPIGKSNIKIINEIFQKIKTWATTEWGAAIAVALVAVVLTQAVCAYAG